MYDHGLINLSNLGPGFSNYIFDSQYTFRQALQAFAHPGRIIPLEITMDAPQPLYIPTAALCLTLLDMETTLWMDLAKSSVVGNWIKFHCGCPILSSPANANYVLITRPQEMPGLDHFFVGTDEYPERSATLIIQVPGFSHEKGKFLRGPGIKNFTRLQVQGIPDQFWESWRLNHSLYPLGIDIFFTSETKIVGLPRTTEVGEE